MYPVSTYGSVTIINLPPSPPDPISSAESAVDLSLPPNPYRGLFAFRPEYADYFFGREPFTNQLVTAVENRRLVAVLGASGSGKSSVVLAGLLPALSKRPVRQAQGRPGEQWLAAIFRPGTDPFQSLAASLVPLYAEAENEIALLEATRSLADSLRQQPAALSDVLRLIQGKHPDHRLLLIADPFEELYTLCHNTATRQAFLDLLIAAHSPFSILNSPFSIVLTLRADFLAQASLYPPLAEVLNQPEATQFLSRMTREQLTEAIVEPAKLRGVPIEEKLVERLLDDMGETEGSLSLLEFTLSELWRHQQHRTLTHAAYEAIGQMKGALSRYAEMTYATLSPLEQQQARRVFMQLVHPGQGAEATCRPATRQALGQQWPVVTKLANARLVMIGSQTVEREDGQAQEQATVDIVHEALIHNWDRLRTWLAADREFLAWQSRLRDDLAHWEATERDDGALLRGLPLAVAQEQLAERPDDLSAAEQAYIRAGLAYQQRREQQRRRLLAGAAIAALVMAVLAALSYWQFQAARTQTHAAIAAEETAVAAAEQANAEAKNAREAEKTAAAEADRARNAEATAQANAQAALVAQQEAEQQARISRGQALAAKAQAEDDITYQSNLMLAREAVLLTWQTDTAVDPVADAVLREVVAQADMGLVMTLPRRHHGGRVTAVAFSPDGRQIVSSSADQTVRVWAAETGEEVHQLRGHRGTVNAVAYSLDGHHIVSGGNDGTVRLWDAATGEEVRQLSGHSDGVNAVAFSPDGQTIISGSTDRTVRLWDAATGEEVRQMSGHEERVNAVAFSPDGHYSVSSSDDGTVRLWDVKTGREVRHMSGHGTTVWSVAYSPDGQTIVSGGNDGTVRL
ncbi:MAG: WD40 repeat domain-containing protein, partial [Anaerolineae bacterium]|nr:WD40 repeat domain-containing protein [Anaerolineae bacterium]